MAGRPATVRGGGLTGLHYALITFVIVAVAALGGLIFLLTGVKEKEERAGRAERQLADLGQPSGPIGNYYKNEATARGQGTTVFAVVLQDLGRIAELVAGTKDATGTALVRESNQVLGNIAERKPDVVNEGDTLLTAIRKLDESHTQEVKAGERLTAQVADLERERESLTQQVNEARTLYEQQVGELRSRHEQSYEEFAEQLRQKDQQLTDLQSTLESREQELQTLRRGQDTQTREMQLTIDRQARQVGELQQTIQDLKGSFDAEAILRKADGRILRAIPGSEIVYINLGQQDNIRPGMTFEVYSQIPTPGQTVRGKASLEVVTAMPETAECRVTRSTSGQPIIEGDICVNIAYEQGRSPKFVVRGEFDLDYDGQIDSFGGTERVESIIREWGGQIVDELDESVDFVIIGVAPRPGETPRGASDIVRHQAEQRRLERSEFQRLIEDARAMYIPVLTQNQFLFLTGYAGQTDIR